MSAAAVDQNPAPEPDVAPEGVEGAEESAEQEQPQGSAYEAKLASLQARARGLESELMKHRNAAAEAQRRADELAARTYDSEDFRKLSVKERAELAGIDFGSWTGEILKDDETPEQKQLRELMETVNGLKSEREQAQEAAQREAQQAQATQELEAIRGALESVEGAEWSVALGQETAVRDELYKWAKENHTDTVPADVQREIIGSVEKRTRELVGTQLKALIERDKSGAFRKMLTELSAPSESEETEPSDEQAIDSRAADGGDGPRSRTLTNRIASSPGTRKAPAEATSESRRDAAIRRLERMEREMEAAKGKKPRR